ncbi:MULTISPECIES: class I adenylate-forming enzyme family protein [unclassified Streptomyces]|uniref:class I adenylate-forming enzyme family protein n=1 Tax=unclassified Streptomyces TaxID=2593676 RepID=UPI00117E8389|nr:MULTISPECIES: class I adenylate-forming enzyme family protein [unclassified Streptomyces]TRO60567.1 acyl-CoA synthetase [Streptomyces sp. IB201691-2A2]
MRQTVRAFQERAEEADFTAVVDDIGPHSARELLACAADLADTMTPDGTPGGTVLLQADNTWRTVAATLAVGMTGGVLALVNRHTTRAEFAAALEDIRPDVVIAEPAALQEWDGREGMPGARQAEVLDGWTVLAGRGPRDVSRWSGGALIGLTSGSTGRPKGVVQSESALRYACSSTADINGLRDGDAVAAVVPLSSTAAYCFGVCMALMLGGPLVLTGRWDREEVLARMAAHDVRWTMCVPTMALQMGSAAGGSRVLEGVRSITVGGGPMDRGALARAERSLGTRILRVFGMSECLGHTSPLPEDPEELRLDRDGRPFPGTELRAIAPDGTVLGPGRTGRAEVRGPSLFLGYARDGKVEPPALTPDGFFPTGDLLMTGDDGTVTVMGREKDVIIRGGRNLDITEIERAVAGHPSVARVCVAPVPDPLLGERAAVLVVPEDSDDALGLDEITAHLARTGLSKAKWPEFAFTVGELPQTTVGKLDRSGARELAGELHARLSANPRREPEQQPEPEAGPAPEQERQPPRQGDA